MADDDQRKKITRRQVLTGVGGVVVAGAAAAVVVKVVDGADPSASHSPADQRPPVAGASPTTLVPASPPGRILQASALCGIYYENATITLAGASNAFNEFTLDLAIGATSWRVLDARGASVGHGTMSANDTALTVCTDGVWHGGSAALPGHYTVVTEDGVRGIVVGHVVVCPPTRLDVPAAPASLGAWLAVAPDRDLYSYQSGHAADMVSRLAGDPYFTGVQDPARPRTVWIAPATQAQAPDRAPSPQDWKVLASALVDAGYAGSSYECPTNEPENGGWTLDQVISYWNDCRRAIHTADPTAKVMGFDSAGVMALTSLDDAGRFLTACKVDAFTDHLEDSHQNLSNIVALRQLFGAMKSQFARSGRSDLDLWLTETGINGGLYGVLQPRRDARQRTVLRMVFESYGWPKEHTYDFRIWDAHGSGLTTFMVDGQFGNSTGNVRAGAYALHVMSEALHGTTCTTRNPPRALSFGPAGEVGDSLLAGLHYRGTARDVVVLATNGMERASVELAVSASGSVTVWDGMGVSSTVPVDGGRIRIPLDDLLTYVFLPPDSTVEVAPAWWSSLSDVARGTRVVTNSHGAGGHVGVLTSGTFGANLQGGSAPVPRSPYVTTTIPATFEVTITKPAKGFALFTGGPAWQAAGSSLVAFTIAVEGKTVYSYDCESARTLPIPSPAPGNSSDPCLYTTFWTGPFAWLEQVDIPAGRVVLTITKASFGGQPDELGSAAPGAKHAEGDRQEIHLTAWQLLG